MISDGAESFGPFRFVRHFGKGGMGLLSLALDSRRNRLVVLKRLRPDAAEDFAQRFEDEIETTKALRHRNLVGFVDEGTIEGVRYLALERVDGPDLDALLERSRRWRRPVTAAQMAAIVSQVLDGLAHAHGHGFLHRDISTNNVVVSYDGRAVLIDLGLVDFRQKRTKTIAGKVAGTGAFVAPERFGGGKATERSDLYSVGVLAWFLLTGGHEQLVETAAEILERLSATRNDADSALSEWLSVSIRADPATRFASAEVMRTALLQAVPNPTTLAELGAHVAQLFGGDQMNEAAELARLGIAVDAEPEGVTADVRRPPPASRRYVVAGAAALGGAAVVAVLLWPRAVAPPIQHDNTDLQKHRYTDLSEQGSVDMSPAPHDASQVIFDLSVAASKPSAVPPALRPEQLAERKTALFRAKLAFREGDYALAIKSAEEASRLGAGSDAELVRAGALLALGRTAEAERVLRRVLAREPANERARELLRGIDP